MEVRYIVFTPEEVRTAVLDSVPCQEIAAFPADHVTLEIVGPPEAPAVIVRSRDAPAPIRLERQDLIAALLLYCAYYRLPLPRRAEKQVEMSVNGLTLKLTSDLSQREPMVADHRVAYGEMATRATQEISTIREELARVTARADYAERHAAKVEDRAQRAEASVANIASMPGLQGWLARLMTNLPWQPPPEPAPEDSKP